MQYKPKPLPEPWQLKPWFAWYPVLTESGVHVWLETVGRGYTRQGIAYYHCLPTP